MSEGRRVGHGRAMLVQAGPPIVSRRGRYEVRLGAREFATSIMGRIVLGHEFSAEALAFSVEEAEEAAKALTDAVALAKAADAKTDKEMA